MCKFSQAKLIFGCLTVFAILMSGCGIWPPPFNRVLNGKLRPIAAVFTPSSDISPGDTLTVHLSFAGNPVHTVDNIGITFNVITSQNGNIDTFSNVYSPTLISSSYSLPDSVSFSFAIPDTVLNPLLMGALAASGIPQDSLMLLLPLLSTSFDASTITSEQDSLLKRAAPFLAFVSLRAYSFCTAHSENGTSLRCRSQFSVRLTRFLARSFGTDSLFFPAPNENPQIRWMGVYKCKGRNIPEFHPAPELDAAKDSLFYIYRDGNFDITKQISDTITIDTGFTYFLAADSGLVKLSNGSIHDSRQKVWTQDPSGDTMSVREEFFYKWFYQNLDFTNSPQDSLAMVGSGDWPVTSLLPPVDVSMHNCKVWVDVYDDFYNETNSFYRPRGMASRQAQFYMKFTNAYAKAVTKK